MGSRPNVIRGKDVEPKLIIRRYFSRSFKTKLEQTEGRVQSDKCNSNLCPVFCVPDVDPAVGGSRDDELRVRRERSLEGDRLGVDVAGEALHQLTVEGVDQPDQGPVGGDQDRFTVRRELESGPLDVFLSWKKKRTVVQLVFKL